MPASRHPRFSLAVLTTPFLAGASSARAAQTVGVERVRDIPSPDVGGMKYLPNSEAVPTSGSDVKGSVIVITPRR